MKVIGYEEADSKLNWSEMADAMEAGHKLEAAEIGDLLLAKGDRSILNRAAWIDGMGIALKSVTIFPENNNRVPPIPSIQGAMFVFDSDTGALDAIVDGPLVTKWKTAGDSVLGARLLARQNSESYLVIGAGIVAKTLLQAYREVFPSLKKFTVWNRSKDRAVELAEDMKSEGIELIVADDLEAAVRDADIISTATMAKEPVLKGAWVQDGTHVDLIGAFRPDMREADDELMLKGRLFVDARETTIGEIGELMIPMAAGVFDKDHVIADFRDLCNGAPGRGSDVEITLFKNGGGAHLDLMTASMIVEKMS